MVVILKSPLMQDKIKDLLDGRTFDGVRFSFVEKKGIELIFSISGDNIETADAAAIAKNAVKATEFGKGIMLSVVKSQI